MNNVINDQESQAEAQIIDAFQAFYTEHKNHQIYAFAIEIDELFNAKYFLISTESSIFDETEDKQQYLPEDDRWNIKKWKYRKKNMAEIQHVSNIATDHFSQDSAITKVFQNALPLDNPNERMSTFLASYQEAIIYLAKIYRLNLNQMLFLVYSPLHKAYELELATQLNPANSFFFEFAANSKIEETKKPINKTKLNQVDKDILIDLAQIVTIVEPFDPLFVAHQAYLLTLTVEFSELNTHIQNLVTTIMSMDNQIFALDKNEILNRINYFYQV